MPAQVLGSPRKGYWVQVGPLDFAKKKFSPVKPPKDANGAYILTDQKTYQEFWIVGPTVKDVMDWFSGNPTQVFLNDLDMIDKNAVYHDDQTEDPGVMKARLLKEKFVARHGGGNLANAAKLAQLGAGQTFRKVYGGGPRRANDTMLGGNWDSARRSSTFVRELNPVKLTVKHDGDVVRKLQERGPANTRWRRVGALLGGRAQSIDGRYEAYCGYEVTLGRSLKWRILERRQTGTTGALGANPLAGGPETFDPAALNPLFVRPTTLFPSTDEGLFASHAIAQALIDGVTAMVGATALPSATLIQDAVTNIRDAAMTVHDAMNPDPIRYSESRAVNFDGPKRVAMPAVVISPFGSPAAQEELEFPGPSISVDQITSHAQFHSRVTSPLRAAFTS